MLQTDKGTEFLNATFQRMLAVNDIHWYSTENEDIKASVVERFSRMLKTKMSRYFTYKNSLALRTGRPRSHDFVASHI